VKKVSRLTDGHLYFGDNLEVLRNEIKDETVDLIYLDPPFNSQASYNILFKALSGEGSEAQIEAFADTWHWNQHAEEAFDQVMKSGNANATEMLRAMRAFLKENDMMAYLAMMSIRLLELRRVLKPTGTLYLHCDSTASHYLKILMDAIFGAANYRNEIIWKRSNPKSHISTNFPTCTDTILRFSKSKEVIYHQPYARDHGWDVRVIDNLAGTFHPKLYVGGAAFDGKSGMTDISLIVAGSANLSTAALSRNGECSFVDIDTKLGISAGRAWKECWDAGSDLTAEILAECVDCCTSKVL